MQITKAELDSFHKFAVAVVTTESTDATWEDLIDRWRIENPTPDEFEENVAAIQEAVEEMEQGRMRPFEEFIAEFKQRNNIRE